MRIARKTADRTRARMRALQVKTDDVMRAYPSSDRATVLRTLMNLELPPLERLRRALRRAPRPGQLHG